MKNIVLPPAVTNPTRANILASIRHWKLTLLILLILVSTGLLVWRHNYENSDKQAASISKQDNREMSYIKVEADSLNRKSEFGDAANLWANYAAATKNRQHKNTAYVNAAIYYMNDRDYAKSLSMCKKAEDSGGVTYEEAITAATAAQATGDKGTAIHYYKLAIKLTPNEPGVANNVDEFKATIKYLGGTP